MAYKAYGPFQYMTETEALGAAGQALNGESIRIVHPVGHALAGQPTGVQMNSGPAGETPAVQVTASNINAVLSSAGGAGWEKVQATAANYVITRPSSGASLDVHIETGGTLAALAVANWPIPASGVDQLRIRNMSAVAQVFTATTGAGGFAGVVTADGSAATSGTYSIPVDMAVHVTIDPDGWVQVAPMGQEVSQAEFDAALTGGSVQALFDTLRADSVHFLAAATDINTLTTTGWYNVNGATNGPAGGGWYYIFHGVHRNSATGAPTTNYGFQLAKRLDTAANNLLMRVQTSGTWTTWLTLATTADIPAYSAVAPVVDGTAAVGTATTVSRGDHVHPTDTTRAAATALTDGSVNAYFDRLRWDGATAISSTNLNSLTVSGFYDGQTLTNAPNGATGWFYILHQRHSNLADVNWHHQTAYALGSGTGSVAGEVYTRSNASGTWTAWVRADTGAVPALSSTAPAMDGTAAVGTGTTAARADHVHASDTSRAAIAGATFTGDISVSRSVAGVGSTLKLENNNYAGSDTNRVIFEHGSTQNAQAVIQSNLPGANDVDLEFFTTNNAVLNSTAALRLTGDNGVVLANALPVAQGGTGSTTAAAALTALGGAPAASPTLTGTVIADGTVRLGAGQDILSPPLVGTDLTNVFANSASTAATTITNADTALRILRAGTSGTKWGNVMDVNIGSHTAGLNSMTRVDFRLSNGGVGTADMTALSLLGNGTAEVNGVPIATTTSPVLTGTPQVGGNPKLGSNAGHTQRSFSDITGAAMLMVPATGTNATTIATSDVAARFVKPGTSGTKANAVLDIVVGSHTAGIAGATQVDFRLANASTNAPDTTVLTLRGSGAVTIPGMLTSAFNGARVTLSAAQSIPNSALTTISWTAETYDTNTYHDNTTNPDRLTAVAAGYYRIGAKVDFSGNATGSRALAYRINAGTAVVMVETMPGGTSPVSMNFSTEVYLTAGQYIDIQVWQSTGGAFNLNTTSFATMSFLGS